MKINLVVIILLFACVKSAISQSSVKDSINAPKVYEDIRYNRLDTICQKVAEGEVQALYDIASYLDSTRVMKDHLGYHVLHLQLQSIARRTLEENSAFLNSEVDFEKITAKEFLIFLKKYQDKIIYDTDAGAFLLTPFKERMAVYQMKELSEARKQELKGKAQSLLKIGDLEKLGIVKLIEDKNPLALYKIAGALYRGRNKFNNYQSDGGEYIALLELLTNVRVETENEKGKLTLFIAEDYTSDSRLNLLIYFATNYQRYVWNRSSTSFINEKSKVAPIDKTTIYFEQLSSKDDNKAMNAFIKLTTCDTAKVRALCENYDRSRITANYTIPTFPYRFLEQLTILTSYCRENHIDFLGSATLRSKIDQLKKDIPFARRLALENNVIRSLKLNEVTAFEYWSLVNENNFYYTQSAGRILDIFYSKNWNRLISDKGNLALYLKKSMLFNRLGIIGACNKYLNKFIAHNGNAIKALSKITSNDKDILVQKDKAIGFNRSSKNRKTDTVITKSYDSNYDPPLIDIKRSVTSILKAQLDIEKRSDTLVELTSKIRYAQIGATLDIFRNIKFKDQYYKYCFLERDFGFYIYDFDKRSDRNAFLKYYRSHTEFEVYAHQLKLTGIDYRNKNNRLDYDKIYELLKYGVVDALAGGGGGKRENEVYSIIKLLEIKFKTTLGFPAKLCNSNGIYGCSAIDRAKEWLDFLANRKLLKHSHSDPESFSYH